MYDYGNPYTNNFCKVKGFNCMEKKKKLTLVKVLKRATVVALRNTVCMFIETVLTKSISHTFPTKEPTPFLFTHHKLFQLFLNLVGHFFHSTSWMPLEKCTFFGVFLLIIFYEKNKHAKLEGGLATLRKQKAPVLRVFDVNSLWGIYSRYETKHYI